MRLACYQPDIPQNFGTILRLCACLDIPTDVIEPCGFPLDDRKFKRAGMDYLDSIDLTKHVSWQQFQAWHQSEKPQARTVLLTTKAADIYTEFDFHEDDILILGRESAGVPDDVHESVDHRVTIPMTAGTRSLNVAISAAMVLGEALRQTKQLPRNG